MINDLQFYHDFFIAKRFVKISEICGQVFVFTHLECNTHLLHFSNINQKRFGHYSIKSIVISISCGEYPVVEF